MLDPSYLNRIRRRERIAQRVIGLGGAFVVICVLGILVQISWVALPLFFEPDSEIIARVPTSDEVDRIVAFGVGDFIRTAYVLTRDGSLRYVRLEDGETVAEERLASPAGSDASIVGVVRHGAGQYTLTWSDGSVSRERFAFGSTLDDDDEVVVFPEISRSMGLAAASEDSEAGSSILETALLPTEEEGFTRVDRFADGSVRLHVRAVVTSIFGDSESADYRFELTEDLDDGTVVAIDVALDGRELIAISDAGDLLRWEWDFSDSDDIREPELVDRVRAAAPGAQLTAVSYVFGDESLVVGDDRGGLTRWLPARSETSGNRRELTQIQTLHSHRGSVTLLSPTQRDKSIVSLDASGTATLAHTTSERRLLDFTTDAPLVHVSINARSDAFAGLDGRGTIHVWELDVPHPEVSMKTLFGEVWYEGYDEPQFRWESSAATQDSEPKISLVPLLFGTIKGTLYAMLFAVPVAVLGALYTSQFLSPRMRGIVKPLIEIMAAIPSVVIGFLAAHWFAPILQKSMTGLFLSFALFPVIVLGVVALWDRYGAAGRVLGKRREGYEFLLLAPVIAMAMWILVKVGDFAEPIIFGSDLQTFLFEGLGVVYDPRNSIVIAFALGFAVVPIIFTIAEDSLSNVPRSLSAGSLALGASRWQTAWRVILPAGAPGIFAATMIGLGRAIGETMIVLMATGNTAIMDWSPFNGMRTISANIATEAAEAPHLGSLYRVLFLSAVILFVMTFILNTIAEIVRHRIRRKYARF